MVTQHCAFFGAVLVICYNQLEFWKVADMRDFGIAEALYIQQSGGHNSEFLRDLKLLKAGS